MSAKPRATRRSQHALVRLSGTSLQCLRRSLELIERITPGNCSHHKGNIRVMLKAVLDEVESPNAPRSATGANNTGDKQHE